MDLLNSAWLIHMIERSGKKPAEKLLCVYSLLDTWLNAPGIRERALEEYASQHSLAAACPVLSAHLLRLATVAKLQNPAAVVAQLMILLQGAVAEELRSPGTGALLTAQQAAKAVLADARPPLATRIEKSLLAGGYAAAVTAIAILGLHVWPSGQHQQAQFAQQGTEYQEAAVVDAIDPDLLLKALAFKRNIQSGICPAPSYASVPQDQLQTYMHVVQSGLSSNPALDSRKLEALLAWYEQHRAWECYSKLQNKQKIILGMGV